MRNTIDEVVKIVEHKNFQTVLDNGRRHEYIAMLWKEIDRLLKERTRLLEEEWDNEESFDRANALLHRANSLNDTISIGRYTPPPPRPEPEPVEEKVYVPSNWEIQEAEREAKAERQRLINEKSRNTREDNLAKASGWAGAPERETRATGEAQYENNGGTELPKDFMHNHKAYTVLSFDEIISYEEDILTEQYHVNDGR